MMDGMNDLVTWLRAQLDEDERVARVADADPSSDCWFDCDGTGHGDHHLRWDPARVLAEVDAKRRILDWLVEDAAFDMPAVKAQGASREEWYSVTLARTTIKLMALPYADRPGYRDEWKP